MVDQMALSVPAIAKWEDRQDPGERGVLLCIALVSVLEICTVAAWLFL